MKTNQNQTQLISQERPGFADPIISFCLSVISALVLSYLKALPHGKGCQALEKDIQGCG